MAEEGLTSSSTTLYNNILKYSACIRNTFSILHIFINKTCCKVRMGETLAAAMP